MKPVLVITIIITAVIAATTYDDEEIDPKYLMTPYGGFPGFEELKTKRSDGSRLSDVFVSHMKVRNYRRAVVFSCLNLQANIQMQKKLSEAGCTSIVLNIESSIEDKLLIRVFPEKENVAVLMDLDCGYQAVKVIEMFSRLNMFDDHRSLLLVTTDLIDAVRTFATANLNVNSDVVAVTPSAPGSESWISFDLYNHGFKYHGKFNMTFRGIYSLSSFNIAVAHTQTKADFPEPLILNQYDKMHKDELTKRIDKMLEDTIMYCGVFKVSKSDELTVQFEGRTARHENGWWIFLGDSWVQRRWKVETITLINAQVSIAKFSGGFDRFVTSLENVHIDSMHRYQYALIRMLSSSIGFRLEHKRVLEWGTPNNESTTGLLGAMYRSEADVTTSPAALKQDRFGYGDNTVITYTARFAMIFKQPKAARMSLRTFTQPLETSVWWVAVVVCFFAISLFVVVVRFENDILGVDKASVEGSWSYAILAIVAVLSQQGPARSPRLCSGRSLSVSALLLGFMLFQFYSASLVGSLLTAPPKLIRSPRDLIEGPFHVGAEEQPYEHVFFKERLYPYVGELYDRKIAPRGSKPAFLSADEGMRKVRRGGFAFQVDTAAAYKIMEQWSEDDICQADEFLVFPLQHLPTRMRRGLPFRQHIMTGYRRIIERGVKARELKTWQTARPKCPPEYTSKLQPIGAQLVPAGVALASAGMLATAVLFIEIIVFQLSRKRRQRHQLHYFNPDRIKVKNKINAYLP